MTEQHAQHLPTSPGFAAVVRLLQAQKDLYAELDELSRRQAGLIDDDRTDELLAVLNRRQEVLEQVQTINDAIAPVRARWQQFLGTVDAAQRRAVGQLVDAIAGLIEAISRRDQADRDRMLAAKQRVAGELAGLDRSRRAASAYGGPAPRGDGGPMFQDREA